jgi:uncharacterized protein YegL
VYSKLEVTSFTKTGASFMHSHLSLYLVHSLSLLLTLSIFLLGNVQANPNEGNQGSLKVIDQNGKPIGECPLKHTEVKINISGFIARATVTQEFTNPFSNKIETIYIFPLPQNAAVDSMTMTIGDRTIRGRIMKREEAQAVYNRAKSIGQVASLLDQERPNIFTQSVANILPGNSIKVTISYVETLKYEDGSYSLAFPTVVGERYIPASSIDTSPPGTEPTINDRVPDAARISPPNPPVDMRAGHNISIEVDLNAGVPIESIRSISHEIDIENISASSARVRLKDLETIPNRDFILKYDVSGKRIEDAILTHSVSQGGFFMLILQPPDRTAIVDTTPKELVFVIDTSGSMNGFPIEKAKESMEMALKNLYPYDTFNLISFAGDTHILFPKPVQATPQNLEEALNFLASRSGSGSTEMMKAIKAALEPSDSQEHIRIVCFMTDGYVGNDMEIISEIKKYSKARVFSFGIGNSVNRFLLDKMAEHGRGEVEYVTLRDDGSAAARRFYERVRSPLLTDISIDWNNLPVQQIYPKQIPDLFSAKPVVLIGRYVGSGQGVIRLKGKMFGNGFVKEIPINLPAVESNNDVIATLWARAKIDDLMGQDYAGLQQNEMKQELKEEITKLGLDYRLMTQFTSFVAVDTTSSTGTDPATKVTVPVEATTSESTVSSSSSVSPGSITETVMISGYEPLLDSSNACTSQVIDTGEIGYLPVPQGNAFYLAKLAPGVVTRPTEQKTTDHTNSNIGNEARLNTSSFLSTLNSKESNEFIVDGVSTKALVTGTAVVPTLDSVEELKVTYSNMPAEHGRAESVINVSTKSGTNSFKGSTYIQHRDERLNANRFENNTRNLEDPLFRAPSFGGTLGGPIVRNRTFFFTSFDILRQREDSLYGPLTFPSEAERIGDFSNSYVSVNGMPQRVRIFDPFTASKEILPNGTVRYKRAEIYPDMSNGIYLLAGRDTNGNPIRGDFLRPTDPIGRRIASLFPSPNRRPEGDPLLNQNNFLSSYRKTYRREIFSSRFDHTLTESNRLNLTAGLLAGRISSSSPFGSDSPFIGVDNPQSIRDLNPHFSISDVVVINPTTIVYGQFGVQRIKNIEGDRFSSFDYSLINLPESLNGVMAVPGSVPDFIFGNFDSFNLNSGSYRRVFETNSHINGKLTKIVGNWTLNVGAEYRSYLLNYTNPVTTAVLLHGSNGQGSNLTAEYINAIGEEVANPSYNPDATTRGYGLATEMLGAGNLAIPSGRNADFAFAQRYAAIYTQNDWKVNHKLTLNLGLRWDIQPGVTERFNRMSSIDLNSYNPYGGYGKVLLAGRDGSGRGLWNTEWNNIAPRVGAAFKINNRSVLRGGYSLIFLPTTDYIKKGLFGSEPFVQGSMADLYGKQPDGKLIGRFYDENVNRITPAIANDPNEASLYGGSGSVRLSREFSNSRLHQWSSSFGYEIGSKWLLSASYYGSKASKLMLTTPLNSTNLLPSETLLAWREQFIRNGFDPGSELVNNPFNPNGDIPFNNQLGTSLITRAQSISKYSLLGNQTIQRPIGFAVRHALELSVQRRFLDGLYLLAGYTWSKSIGVTDPEIPNVYNRSSWNSTFDYSYFNTADLISIKHLTTNDTPHRFVVSYIYELPFGKEKQFYSSNRVLNWMLSDWYISSIGIVQSGTPLIVTGASNGSLNGRPDRLLNVALELPKAMQRWYGANERVQLPSGRYVTICGANPCYAKYNPEAFAGRVVTIGSTGEVQPDRYWYGNAALTYNDLRTPNRNSWDIKIARTFKWRENLSLEFAATISNILNHAEFLSDGKILYLGETQILKDEINRTPIGAGDNGSYGTHNQTTYNPRQIELQVKLRF